MIAPLRLGVLLTHPVQYYAPLFRRLHERPEVQLEVFFAHRPTPAEQGIGFGVEFEWDVETTSGFPHRFLCNRARHPDVSSFNGCDTPEIGSLIAARRYDAFLVMGWHARSYWQAIRACWRTGTPVMVRGDSQLPAQQSRMKGVLKRALYPAFMRRFASCLSVGIRSEQYFRHYGARRIVRSPHFVDNDYFRTRAGALSREEARARLGIASDAFVPLFVGKLVPKKRPLDFIDAVSRTKTDLRCALMGLIVGEGELGPLCRNRAEGEPIRFLGFRNQSELPLVYAAADVIVLPSDGRETWGLVVNEAMACRVPALVSREAGCSPDLIQEGTTGYTFAKGDVGGLASRLGELARQPRRLSELGAAAAEWIERFTVEAAVAGVVEAAVIPSHVSPQFLPSAGTAPPARSATAASGQDDQ